MKDLYLFIRIYISRSKSLELSIYFFFDSTRAYRIRKLIVYLVISTNRLSFLFSFVFSLFLFRSSAESYFQVVLPLLRERFVFASLVSGGLDLMMKFSMKSQFWSIAPSGLIEEGTSNLTRMHVVSSCCIFQNIV